MSTESSRPTIAEIDLNALSANFRSSKEFIGPDLNYMAVVKANAYGHGAVACARRLEADGVEWFGVALPEEAVELRQNGITTPILCLGGFWPGQESLLIEHDITPVLFDLKNAQLLNKAAQNAGKTAPYHVKIDTGMGRIGSRFDAVEQLADQLAPHSNLRLEGLMTHFAAADDLGQTAFTDLQMARFDAAVQTFRDRGFSPEFIDLANSPAAVVYPKSRGNMVRIGGILYGLGGDVLPGGVPAPGLKPVLSLKSKIGYLKTVPKGETIGYGRTFRTERDSLIATIPIGYHDGYPRALSNLGRVIVNGHFAPVVGRISMDWTTIDVTDVPGAAVGDEVVLIGSQGDAKVTSEHLARLTDTISYEITCGIGDRVPRKFLGQRDM